MKNLREKKCLLDYQGINASWNRFYGSDFVTVVSTIAEMKKLFDDGAILRFSRPQDLDDFRVALGESTQSDSRLGLLNADTELTAAGFSIVHNYSSLSQIPQLHFVDTQNGIALEEIEMVGRMFDPCEPKSVICCGGRIGGDLLRFAKGRLSILLGEGASLNFSGSLCLGENTSITLERNAVMNLGSDCTIGPGSQIYLREGAEFFVGDRARFGRTTVQGFLRIEVGKDFLSAHDLVLRDGDGHDISGLEAPNAPKAISIGEHVWIGEQVALLKGAKLGFDSVVARGSIITKEFPPSSLVGGAPARLLRSGIAWTDEYTSYQAMKNSKKPFL